MTLRYFITPFLRPSNGPCAVFRNFSTAARRTEAASAPTSTVASTPANPTPRQRSSQVTASQLPYFVGRSPSRQLPVYTDLKSGGTRKETRIRKITGDIRALRDDLADYLKTQKVRDADCVISSINQQIVVKGHLKLQISRFLEEKGF
ncbi:hypothetical protein EJ06DRAFT_582581 [Trichodelitschia bisporula]|uniref:Large ribosomal subunit protein mL49 n=1 Tax=Trichodelitschia bisporula TaxID=703511 RepID=A0A6G1HVB7_9PEZI|nr:hypothetical protein EJ06DRAFT_582581 [Trichodelitschia bisporula]